jgi:hypothetical protein
VCGEETATGAVFYSDRRAIDDPNGHPAYLCALCDERVRTSLRRGRSPEGGMPEVDGNGLWAIIGTLRTDARR